VPEIKTEEVETDVGRLLVHADDEVITPILRHHGVWEKELGDVLRQVLAPGMTAVDVGANIGYTALLMAQCVGRQGTVVALEPEHRNAELLRRNAARSQGAEIRVIEAAAWSEPTTLQLALSDNNAGDHRVGSQIARERVLVDVPAVTLDDVLPDRVDVLLLDTQASEHIALRGARRLIERSRTLVFVEFWPEGLRDAGGDPHEVLAEYRAMGFTVSGAEQPLPSDPAALVAAVAAADPPFTTLRLEPAPDARPTSVADRVRGVLRRRVRS
jgi:FkbM family methyltransferase